MKRVIILSLLIVIFGTRNVQSTTIEFHTDGVIQDGDEYEYAAIFNFSTVGMTGGKVEAVSSYDSSTFNLIDGVITDLYILDSSSVYIYGGRIDSGLSVNNSSSVSLFGGSINTLKPSDSGKVYVYGSDFDYVHVSGGGLLSGLWLDDTPFNIFIRNLREPFPGSQIFLIPEPCTLLLLSLGGLMLRKRKISR